MRKLSGQLLLGTIAGVVLAVFTLMLGCTWPWQLFGVMCGHNSPFSAVLLTGFFWLTFALIFYVRMVLKALG